MVPKVHFSFVDRELEIAPYKNICQRITIWSRFIDNCQKIPKLLLGRNLNLETEFFLLQFLFYTKKNDLSNAILFLTTLFLCRIAQK